MSTLPQTDTQTKSRKTGQKFLPKWVSQELCYLTSGGIRGRGREGGASTRTVHRPGHRPASCSTMLELSRGPSISAWHRRPALSQQSELTASQKFLTREKAHFSPSVDNRARSTLGSSVRDRRSSGETALQADTRENSHALLF